MSCMYLFTLLLCLFINLNGSYIINYKNEYRKICNETGIKEATKEQENWINMIIEKRQLAEFAKYKYETEKEAERAKYETEKEAERKRAERAEFEAHNLTLKVGKLKKENDLAEAKANKYIIFLTVPLFATMIEDEFPNIKNDKSMIPATVLKNTPSHSRHWVNRKYQFLEILKVGEKEESEYVVAILKVLEKYYKKTYKTVTIDKESAKYEKFLLRFCTSIVEAIKTGNDMAHQGTGSVVKMESLGAYSNVVDPFMTVFYNALVGKDPEKKVKERMNKIDLDENESDE